MCITMTLEKNTEFTGRKLLDKKTRSIILLVFVSALILTGCRGSKETSPDIIARYQIPFAAVGQRWNQVELMELDAMGRELYVYQTEGQYTNVFSDYMDQSYVNAPVIAYLIVQKADRDFVYCYQQICYEYAPSAAQESSDIITSLKAKNDWGKPLCDEKMTAFPKDTRSNGISDFTMASVEGELVDGLEKEIGNKIENYYLDCIFLINGTPVFVLREVRTWVSQTSKNVFGESYVFVRTETGKIQYERLSDRIQDWNEEIDCFLQNQKNQGTVL